MALLPHWLILPLSSDNSGHAQDLVATALSGTDAPVALGPLAWAEAASSSGVDSGTYIALAQIDPAWLPLLVLVSITGVAGQVGALQVTPGDLLTPATQDAVQAALISASAGSTQVSSSVPNQCESGFSLILKRGDTLPSVSLHLLDGSGQPVSLPAETTVQFHMARGGQVKVDAAAQIVDASTGLVQYAWEEGDTDTTGFYAAELQVTFPNGSIETWPNQGNLTIRIISDVA